LGILVVVKWDRYKSVYDLWIDGNQEGEVIDDERG
jgi:hypothetical protein